MYQMFIESSSFGQEGLHSQGKGNEIKLQDNVQILGALYN